LANIQATVDKCEFVRSACDGYNTVDYFDLRYCTMPDSTYAFIAAVMVTVIVSFYLLSNISDKYLSPSLSMISKKLNLSEVMAGVTILAFANGAPDIIASFSAGGDANGGVFISIGSLFGGCIFASTIVLGICILNSKTGIYVDFVLTEMDHGAWLRAICFYIAAAVMVLIFGYIGTVTFPMALCFFVLYLMYVHLMT
jgi:solute carrier family 24 (sodium/potassium/calcium exchanger), member 6